MALTIVAPMPRVCKVCGCGLLHKSGRGRPAQVCRDCRRRCGGHYREPKPCEVCQSVIPSGAYRKKYCSDLCAEIGLEAYRETFSSARRKPPSCNIRQCGVCQNLFNSTHAQRKLCDDCKKTHDGVHKVCECKHCGVTFRPKRRDRVQFCSRECGFNAREYTHAAHYKQSSERREALARAKELRKNQRQSEQLQRLTKLYIKNCKACGQRFDRKIRKFKHTCSEACQVLYVQNSKKENQRRTRKRLGGNKHRHRARYHGVAYEPVNVQSVFERDRWRCMICGVKTPPRLRGTYHPQAPELDHRIPMAMGGSHSYDNVQCACRKCNSAKSGTKIIGQLPLFINGL